MKRRPCLLAAVCAVCAQLAALYCSAWIQAAVLAAVILETGLLVYAIAGGAWKYMLWPVIFLTFLSIFCIRLREIAHAGEEMQQICDACAAEGLAGRISRMEEKNGRWYLYIGDAAYVDGKQAGGLLVITEELSGDVIPGCTVLVRGTAERIPSATNPGQFDAASYYMAQGYMFRSFSPKIIVLRESGWLQRHLYRIKCRVKQVLSEISCEQDLGVWNAILLGDKAALDEDTKALFQTGGISHILAISGLHISFIGMLLYKILRKTGLPIILSSAVSSVILACYTLLTGSSISAQRACVMMLLSFGAGCLGRTPDMLSSMSMAWILISVRYPWQITQAGCQLSFAAILAVGVLLPIWKKNLGHPQKKGEPIRIKVLRRVCSAILCSAAIQLLTWPILAWHYFQISVYALFINLLVLPLTGILFGTLLFAVTTAIFCGGLGAGMLLPRSLILPAHLIMVFYRRLCTACALLPGNTVITGQPRWWQVFLYAGGVMVTVLFLLLRGSRRAVAMEQEAAPVNQRTGMRKNRVREYAVFFAMLLLFFSGGLKLLVRVRGTELTAVFMDVGQGDGIFLQSGSISLFIDGGSSSISNVGLYRISPLLQYYGVTNVNAWFLTHPDQDHISGFLELMDEYGEAGTPEIDSVIIARADCESSAWSAVKESLFINGISCQLIEAGMMLQTDLLKLECLYPQSREVFADANDLCSVLRVEYGEYSILLMGDVSSEVEKLLCVRYADNAEKLFCDLLKVAHHGSRYSSSEEFLNMTGSAYAVISCGKNVYGHPAPETITRLMEAGMELHITEEEGAVIITFPGDV